MTGVPPALADFSRRAVAALRARPLAGLVGLTAAVSLLFFAFPALDLAAAGLFHRAGEGFPASRAWFPMRLRDLGIEAFRGLMIVCVLSLAGPLLLSGSRLLLPPRAGLFLLTSAVLGPGLLVNVLFKGEWGRARPYQVSDFGGELPFSRPWVIAGNCSRNCSFVAGEASSTMIFLGLAMIAPSTWRPWVAGGALAFTAVMSINRMAFGGHFLSDVLIAWGVTLIVLVATHRAIYRPGGRLTDAAIADGLGGVGDAAKAALGSAGRRAGAFLRQFR